MSHRSLRACGSHGTSAAWISFHPLQHETKQEKIVRFCVRFVSFCRRLCLYDRSPTCLPLFPGRPVGPLFPAVPGSPFGPISPCQKKPPQSEKTDVKISQSLTWTISSLLLKLIYCLTFCPSMPGKPMAPCGERRADGMQCRYVPGVNGCVTADKHSHLVAFCSTLRTVSSRTLESKGVGVTSHIVVEDVLISTSE